MDNSYHYTTTDQQIHKLKSQLLTFEDETRAKQILQTYGYYNIINGYRDPYIIREYGKGRLLNKILFFVKDALNSSPQPPPKRRPGVFRSPASFPFLLLFIRLSVYFVRFGSINLS